MMAEITKSKKTDEEKIEEKKRILMTPSAAPSKIEAI